MKTRKLLKGLLSVFLVIVCVFGIGKKADAAIVGSNHQKYSYGEMKKDISQLQKKYGNYMQVNTIGTTADGRALTEIAIGDVNAKKHLLVIANLHAREYMTTQLCMKQIEYYLSNYNKKLSGSKVSDVLKQVCIHYIPSCNPDGTAISQYGFKAIRNKKLRSALNRMRGGSSTWKANARGVDLNRNWDIAFRRSGKAGSQGYHGTSASSEAETKALVNWVNSVQKQGTVVGIISYHSTGSIIYGRCASQANASVKKQTSRMTNLAKNLTSYSIMPVESISAANSCSREYFLYKKKLPCITIEVGRGSCPLKTKEFSSIWKKNKNLVLREAMLFK